MSDITRSEAIKTLKEHLSHWEWLLQEHICEEQEGIDTISALKLAIASLETDEMYQLEYEQPEFCENCIDRDYTAKYVEEFANNEYVSQNEAETIYLIADGIRHIPRALPDVHDNNVGNIDCISREQAKAVIRDKFKDLPSRVEINTLLNELPPATPIRPKGHWILGGYEDYYYVCDQCGFKASEYWYKPEYHHCPNCGARMVEPQESEDKE